MNTDIISKTVGETPMSVVDAIEIIEGGDADEDTIIEAWQTLADSGVWRSLQGFYQRGMQEMVDQGLVTLP